MSTLQEIEAAIRNLPSSDRSQLLADLPALFPEMDGDAAWERLLRDARPRPALNALLDEAETELREAPTSFAETSEAEFERHS